MKTTTLDIDSLIKGCIRGDKKAHELFYKHYHNMLMAVVRKYFKSPEVAEEVLHNSFIKIFRSLKSFEHRGSFDGWMKRITYHCVSDYVRLNEKYLNKTQLTDEEFLFDSNAHGHQNNLDFHSYMKLIETLETKPRTVFLMYVMDDLSHQEISEIMDIPIGTSKWYLSEARKILKEKINYIQKYSTNELE